MTQSISQIPPQFLPDEEKEFVRQSILDAGAVAVGFAIAEPVEERFDEIFDRWLSNHLNGELQYMANHRELRRDPRLLLESARSVISVAFSYRQPKVRDAALPMISQYAYGADYHDIIRQTLIPLSETLNARYGAQSRICIDSAPIPERYWAVKAGIGFRACNGAIIIPRHGSMVFLAEILISAPFSPDAPDFRSCLTCGKCVKACPAAAISSHGIDAARCLSAITIEHKGEFTHAQRQIIEAAPDTLFGCDRCQTICPHNADLPDPALTIHPKFLPNEKLLTLTAEEARRMTAEEFRETFRRSPIKRAKLLGLHRNATAKLP